MATLFTCNHSNHSNYSNSNNSIFDALAAAGATSEGAAGITVIGEVPQAIQPAFQLFKLFPKTALTNIILDYGPTVSNAQKLAQNMFILQQGMSYLNQMYNSGELPEGVTPQMVQQAYQTFMRLMQSSNLYSQQTPTDAQGNVVALGPQSIDLSSSIASASVEGGGQADGGGGGGGGGC